MSNATPGPWEVVALNGFGPWAIRMPTPAGSKHLTHYGVGQIGTKANAHLIAAAPDMLAIHQDSVEILEAVLEDREYLNCEEDEILRDLISRIKSAIARARGEQP